MKVSWRWGWVRRAFWKSSGKNFFDLRSMRLSFDRKYWVLKFEMRQWLCLWTSVSNADTDTSQDSLSFVLKLSSELIDDYYQQQRFSETYLFRFNIEIVSHIIYIEASLAARDWCTLHFSEVWLHSINCIMTEATSKHKNAWTLAWMYVTVMTADTYDQLEKSYTWPVCINLAETLSFYFVK